MNIQRTERVMLSREEVDNLLSPGDQVHTFKQAAHCLLGCDWDRGRLLDLAEKGGAELAGEMAIKMKHGVVIWDGNDAVFCATA